MHAVHSSMLSASVLIWSYLILLFLRRQYNVQDFFIFSFSAREGATESSNPYGEVESEWVHGRRRRRRRRRHRMWNFLFNFFFRSIQQKTGFLFFCVPIINAGKMQMYLRLTGKGPST